MQQIATQLISQPWSLPVLVGIGALLLGLLIPRRGGVSWLSGIIFFLPNLFLDLLDVVHTKKFKYYGLITALLSIEAFFAFRASTVYYDVLNTHMPLPEMVIVCVIVFVAVFLCGYMVATHGKLTFWSGCTMVFVVFHDWAGTVWMNYSQPVTSTVNAVASSTDQATNDGLKIVLTIGMCVLGLLPFIMGAWAEELRPQLEKELDEEVDAFTSTATRKIKRRAVERVLRLANHTNIVHLVRALPADEFTEFKQFVMPIIAPGTPHNLVHSEQQSETDQSGIQATGEMSEQDQPETQPENHQTDMQKASEVNGSLVASEQSNESHSDTQLDQQKAVRKTARKQPGGNAKSTAKPVNRDAKIRQFAAEHPDFTYAQLAAKYHLSASTISRVLNAQQATPAQPQESNSPDATPAPNGHHKEQERDTDAMESISIREEELLTLVQQN